jgi:hypothetical protein
MVERVRQGHSIEMTFVEHTVLKPMPEDVLPVGRVGKIPNVNNMKRLRSRHEISAGHRKKARPSNDGEHAQNNVKTKTCTFCRQPGHKIGRCSKITIFGQPVCGEDDRSSLVSNLGKSNYYVVARAPEGDLRVAVDTLPPKMKGIVIHAKEQRITGEIFYRTTALMQTGDPHHIYERYPFSNAAVTRFIIRNKTSIVICLLRLADDGYQSFGFPPLPSSTQQRSMFPTLSQGSYHVPVMNSGYPGYSQSSFTGNPMDRVGYGLHPADL